jgi:hypothetical protein
MTQAQPIRWRRLRWALAAALLVLLFVALLLTWRGQAGAAAGDPLRFSHQKHVAAGVPCVFCHPGALNGPVASVPSVQKCVGCHQNIQVTSEEGQADVDLLMQLWTEGQPLRWVKTYDQPDFVYFSHQPHISAGVNCEACHGDVSQMTVVRQAYRINMGFCLHCHRQQGPEKVERLVSCATCHK